MKKIEKKLNALNWIMWGTYDWNNDVEYANDEKKLSEVRSEYETLKNELRKSGYEYFEAQEASENKIVKVGA